MVEERRSGKDRRYSTERRQSKKKSWFMTICLTERRGDLDRRSGLDRRGNLSVDYRKEFLIEVTKRGMIKNWDSAKAKMTYLWDKGLKAITFMNFQKGKAVEVRINTPQGTLAISGRILRMQKIFTEHGFATEMDVQFEDLNEYKRVLINQIIWGD